VMSRLGLKRRSTRGFACLRPIRFEVFHRNLPKKVEIYSPALLEIQARWEVHSVFDRLSSRGANECVLVDVDTGKLTELGPQSSGSGSVYGPTTAPLETSLCRLRPRGSQERLNRSSEVPFPTAIPAAQSKLLRNGCSADMTYFERNCR
jgi:hypothetical protein